MADFSDLSTLAAPVSFRCTKPAGTHPEEVKSAVFAPDGQIYLTDGHHSVSALRASTLDSDITLSLRITDDLRHLSSMAAFWDYMQQHHLVWLTGPMGKIAPQELPAQVGISTMQDGPYRSVLYFLRGIAYERPEPSPPFLEFYLGAWLKSQLAITPADTATSQAYFALLQKAAQIITQASPETHTLPDSASPTLQQLGQFTEVNHKN
ncbi:MAG: ParB/Srx family N-terminal domain-containing protein [Symbiopectobacterium sp.]|uniref:ParB/Srx family N-terminal domain-containing protein n=1 Tax=Symbiopectobacterium sp. TaxID=2952789 RepID=UPI0039E90138